MGLKSDGNVQKLDCEGVSWWPVVRISCFHCHGPGSIPGLGTEILQAMWHRQKFFLN